MLNLEKHFHMQFCRYIIYMDLSDFLAQCYMLGSVSYDFLADLIGSGGRRHRFARPAAARHAANVLGSTLGELSDLVFNHQHLLSR